MMRNRIQRSRTRRLLGGVCGGLAEHFGLDPTGVRIMYVIVSILSAAFPGILVYIILWLLIPMEEPYSGVDEPYSSREEDAYYR